MKQENFHPFITALARRLKTSLPGANAHAKMSPANRVENPGNTHFKKAGVLLLLYPENKSICFPLIRRTEYPGAHSGQISLPGGKWEEGDQNLTATAIRETREEIGITIPDIKIIGNLSPLYIHVSNFNVYPSVAYCDRKPEFNMDISEVREILEIDLLRFRHQQISHFIRNIQGIPSKVPCYKIDANPPVWGATAMILNEFVEIIGDLTETPEK